MPVVSGAYRKLPGFAAAAGSRCLPASIPPTSLCAQPQQPASHCSRMLRSLAPSAQWPLRLLAEAFGSSPRALCAQLLHANMPATEAYNADMCGWQLFAHRAVGRSSLEGVEARQHCMALAPSGCLLCHGPVRQALQACRLHCWALEGVAGLTWGAAQSMQCCWDLC